MREELNEYVTATASGGLATTLPVGPAMYREEWKVTRYTISLSSGNGVCTIYRDYVSAGTQIDYTRSGGGDTSENNSITLRVGNKLIAQWSDVPDGVVGTIVFYGVKTRG